MKFLEGIFGLLLILVIISFISLFSDQSSQNETLDTFPEPSGHFNIFFVETRSPKDRIGHFKPRQACAIESAARLNPDWNVYVFFIDVDKFLEDPYWNAIYSLPNVHVRAIDPVEFSKGLPTESLLLKGLKTQENWLIAHKSDVMRYTILYKYAGVYMDLDAISLKSLDKNNSNFVILQEPTPEIFAAAGVIGFSDDEIGRKIAKDVVEDVAFNYRGDTWSDNSVGKLTRAVQRLCETNYVDKAMITGCHGFKLYPLEKFYAIPYGSNGAFFDPAYYQYGMDKIKNSTGTHLWNYLSADKKAEKGSHTVICEIAEKSCPKTYSVESKYCL